VAYCNALSAAKGFDPAYTITNVVKTAISGTGTPGILSITSATVTIDWNANGYRLPTEAEWEYAAKSGGMGPYNTYAGSNNANDVAWYNNTSNLATHEVGGLAPNGFGLYDMSGNVSEWCWDWYDADYYTSSPLVNPKGPDTGTARVRRGGAWSNNADNVRSVVRNSFTPDNNTWVMGFRVVRPYTP
jgi:formylglycine-generating enzyme required for sulfatase activity